MQLNLFASSDENLTMPQSVRSALGNFKFDSPPVLRLLEALKIAKIKYRCPGWTREASTPVHVAIPSKKVAVRVMSAPAARSVQSYKESWEKAGWRYVALWQIDVMQHSPASLALQLLEYLKTL